MNDFDEIVNACGMAADSALDANGFECEYVLIVMDKDAKRIKCVANMSKVQARDLMLIAAAGIMQ